ncbi:DJ-1/PfpI family protein [Pseudoleptotrichia goodfellowii]|uniref:DJ-1/PfpI family protein n=1 Tax=Pseudoleptotrichia goodfellowii TaxID=157692 RepID=UPI00055D9C22
MVFVILDKFADWEVVFLSTTLNNKRVARDYIVKYASTDKEIKTSMGNLKVLPDMTIDEISDDIKGIVLIGADGSWRNLNNEMNDKIMNLVQRFKKNGKVVGAICDAVYYLAVNGLLNDCKHTANSLEEIENNKNYKNRENYIQTDEITAVTDGKTVTASGTAPFGFAVNVLKVLEDISEKNINFLKDMYTEGFTKAFEKYNEIK